LVHDLHLIAGPGIQLTERSVFFTERGFVKQHLKKIYQLDTGRVISKLSARSLLRGSGMDRLKIKITFITGGGDGIGQEGAKGGGE
jgi:hypothetical protein